MKKQFSNQDEVIKPYDSAYYAAVPTKLTKFFRTFIPYQFFKFISINLKMIKMIRKSHNG